jgi:hypothetical protein
MFDTLQFVVVIGHGLATMLLERCVTRRQATVYRTLDDKLKRIEHKK